MRCIRPLILGAAVALYAGASATADRPLGSAKQLSPGAVIGTSYWDRQCNFATTRRVHLSTAAGRELVHHVWTFQPAPPVWERTAHYRLYDIAGGAYSPGVDIPEGTRIRAGFGDMWITDDNRAVIAYQHYSDPDQRYHLWTAFDSAAGAGEFSNLVEIPDSIDFYSLVNYQSPLWPHVAYVEGVHDTVLHIVAQESLQYPDSVAIFYFRRVGSDSDPTAVWDYPPRVIDSNYNWGSHQLAATSDGRVAIAWTANVPCAGDPDTASGVGCSDFVFWENDLYFQVSNDQGLTWQNRVNVTRYSETPEHPYRAHWEISALFDHLGVLHMIWSAAAWPRTAPGPGEVAQTASAIFHWSETNPTPTMVRETNWNQTVCGGGEGRPLNIGDISLAECDGRLYTLFVQFNDYDAGIMSDCCDSNLTFYPDGAANGDLYICVSSDGGLTWDAARNLTSTRTPGCRFDTPGNVCACESWPSVTPYGSNVSIDPSISGADVVVPAGGSDPGWYLDVQYVLDPLPSSPMTQEGWRTETSIRWFRIACVDPIQEPDLAILPDSLAYPVYTPHCAERLVPIVLSNSGVGEGHYSIIAEEFAGPAGWLGTTGFSGTVAAGAAADTGYVVLNPGGALCSPGAIVRLAGRLRFDSNDPNSPHYVLIDLVAADTVCLPSADTLTTACVALQVFNDAGFGGRGAGGVTMDYSMSGDCDPAAATYLSDASPIVIADTLVNWSVYGCDFLAPHGLVPLASASGSGGGFRWSRSLATVRDSSLILETDWYAPLPTDSCAFLIQRLSLYAADALPHTVSLGQLIDWNIPSDSGLRNGSDTLVDPAIIYQYGAEYHQDPGACRNSDRRMGAVFPLAMYRRAALHEPLVADSSNLWHCAQTRATDACLDTARCGLDAAELELALSEPGRRLYSATVPESTYTDLHTLVGFVSDLSLVPGETLVVYTGLATVADGDTAVLRGLADQARQWYCDHLVPDPPGCGCCRLRGDVNRDSGVKVSDLTFLASYLFRGGPEALCPDEADATGDGEVKVSDLTYLTAYLFRGGPAPIPC